VILVGVNYVSINTLANVVTAVMAVLIVVKIY